jgi:hypothetical protein
MKYSVDNLDKVSIIKVTDPQLTEELCSAIEQEAMALIDDKGVADIILDLKKVKSFCPETHELLQMIQLSTAHLNGMFIVLSEKDKREDMHSAKSVKFCNTKDEAMDLIFENHLQRNLIEDDEFDEEDEEFDEAE